MDLESQKYNRGQALLLVISLIGFLLVIAMSLVTVFQEEIGLTMSQSFSTLAAGAADAGIEHAKYKIIEGLTLPGSTSDEDCLSDASCFIPEGSNSPHQLDNGATYYVRVTKNSATSTVVRSVGSYRGVRRTFELVFYK